MTEESAANREDHPAARRASDRAIANSSPDFNHMMMRLVRNLLSTQQSGPVVQTASMFFGLLLAMLMLFFVVGLPALNGTTILIDKLSESRSAERSYQLDMFKLQTDLEIKKLDRTMLGDGAMKTLLDISKKMDEQAVAQVADRPGRGRNRARSSPAFPRRSGHCAPGRWQVSVASPPWRPSRRGRAKHCADSPCRSSAPFRRRNHTHVRPAHLHRRRALGLHRGVRPFGAGGAGPATAGSADHRCQRCLAPGPIRRRHATPRMASGGMSTCRSAAAASVAAALSPRTPRPSAWAPGVRPGHQRQAASALTTG